ncbi:hypothetical protein SeMB42_g07872 [Synchytrium endobioticum]|uniref:Uncharacterized protein n=1 Tax=Synchytrium endobioticum TaxID=286115 RepID=A0A507CQ32_9FUNG|nr:hypothetical protein SeMB42_g07872 [Synchytrium endobioticum]TPX41242.1 hypothetical protein SeLEV6574_g06189 [Synchytrium endobioticum]TPX41247.1 hypothetical protein SeLEV6574_g06191 [Synchytrium endobioticum]
MIKEPSKRQINVLNSNKPDVKNDAPSPRINAMQEHPGAKELKPNISIPFGEAPKDIQGQFLHLPDLSHPHTQ